LTSSKTTARDLSSELYALIKAEASGLFKSIDSNVGSIVFDFPIELIMGLDTTSLTTPVIQTGIAICFPKIEELLFHVLL